MDDSARSLTVSRLVVVFDICSSTTILEDLLRSEHQERWKDLLIKLKSEVVRIAKANEIEVHKFLGDGWILLFPHDVSGVLLLSTLQQISKRFHRLYFNDIDDLMSVKIPAIGMTFGIDKGTLMRVRMNRQIEYVGRPINVAARLQSRAKDEDILKQYRVLISQAVFADFEAHEKEEITESYEVERVLRSLKNVSGGERYRCTLIDLYNKPK